VDGERWDGDPEHMPRRQSILFAVEPVEGEQKESVMYKAAAKSILAGQSTREAEVAGIAKATKMSKARVGERLDAAIAEQKAAQRAAAAQAPDRKKGGQPKAPAQPRLEKAEPKRFADLRDALGLTNKECAAALEAAGMGHTLSRVTELTHSKGASTRLFGQVEKAWTDYAKALKAKGAPR
jgi:predicted DNA-binding transcriptional regulator YafY